MTTYSAEVLADSPVRAFHLDAVGGPGSELDDYSPNASDGSLVPGYTLVAAHMTNGIQTNGTSGYINIPHPVFTTAWSLEFLYKWVSSTGVWRDATSSGGWLLLIAGANCTLRANGTDHTLTGLGTILADGNYHWVLHSSTGTAITTEVRNAITGAVEFTDTWAVTVNASTINAGPIRFGRNGTNNQFHGLVLDECNVYAAALSTARFQAHVMATIAPGVPTAVVATPDEDSASLSWSPPATGGTVDSYEVRIDGGAPTAATSPHDFTGLTPGGVPTYDLEVRAVGPAGTSAWVLVTTATDSPTPPGYWRADLTVGSHSWSLGHGDTVDLVDDYPHVVLPFTCGWDMPDNVDFFPVAPNLTTVGFKVQCNDAADLADVVKGTPVAFLMYVDNDPDADIWQRFDGVVTQLDAVTVVSPADVTKRDVVVTVFAADNNARLSDKPVGWSDDWPVEHIHDRVERIATEAGIPEYNDLWDGGVGWLPARSKGSPMSALSALQQATKDAAEEYDSEFPLVFFGRPVFQYEPGGLLDDAGDPVDEALNLYSIRRRVFPSGFGSTVTLDGGLVRAAGQWSKQSGPAAHTWGIVDTTTFGTPDSSVPFYRSTGLLDTFSVPGDPINHSATERDALGSSLVADGSTSLTGWASRSLVYEAWLDPAPVARWANLYRYAIAVHPVVVTPIGPELELNGVDYVAGTLVGARLTIPPGGRYTVEFRLRSELLPGTDLP